MRSPADPLFHIGVMSDEDPQNRNRRMSEPTATRRKFVCEKVFPPTVIDDFDESNVTEELKSLEDE